MDKESAVLVAEHIHKRFGDNHVLKGISMAASFSTGPCVLRCHENERIVCGDG